MKTLDSEEKRVKIYKCPDCSKKFKRLPALYKHVEEVHSHNIDEGVTIKQYVFNRRNKKTKGSCVICQKETKWNEESGRYERFCADKCKKIAGERAKANMKKKYGTEHLLNDPDMQKKMQNGRSIAGTYKFSDGGEVDYLGSYEKDFLEFCDQEMKYPSEMIMNCEIIFKYTFEKKEKFYMPDFYIPELNLIVEIKDGGDNPNKHHKIQSVDKEKEKLKDLAIIEDKQYNYIKVVNKEYDEFIHLVTLLKKRSVDAKKDFEPVIVL